MAPLSIIPPALLPPLLAIAVAGIIAFIAWAEWDIRKCYRNCAEFNRKAKEEHSLTHCICR